MEFAGNRAHRYPVKRHTFTGFARICSITRRLRNHRKGKRIDEGSETIWIKRLDRSRRVKRQSTAESPRRECGRGSNHGLAKKFAASSQEINLRCNRSEQLDAQCEIIAAILGLVVDGHFLPSQPIRGTMSFSALRSVWRKIRRSVTMIGRRINSALKKQPQQFQRTDSRSVSRRNKSLRSVVFGFAASPSRGPTPKISCMVFSVELWV